MERTHRDDTWFYSETYMFQRCFMPRMAAITIALTLVYPIKYNILLCPGSGIDLDVMSPFCLLDQQHRSVAEELRAAEVCSHTSVGMPAAHRVCRNKELTNILWRSSCGAVSRWWGGLSHNMSSPAHAKTWTTVELLLHRDLKPQRTGLSRQHMEELCRCSHLVHMNAGSVKHWNVDFFFFLISLVLNLIKTGYGDHLGSLHFLTLKKSDDK